MRLKVLGLVVIAAVVLILGWVERSQSQAPQPQPEPAQVQAQPGAFQLPTPPLVAALDANRDGELSAEELDKADAALKTLDKNNDGELNDEELGGALPFPGAGGRGGQGGRGGRGGPGGGRGGPGAREAQKVLVQFDANKDGMLDREERPKAREFAKKNRPAGGRGGPGGFFGGGPGGPGAGPGGAAQPGAGPGAGATPPAGGPNDRGGPGGPGGGPGGPGGPGGGGFGQGGNNAPRQPGERLSPDEVKKYPDAKLYDANVLRTVFFEFDNKDWEEELEDFHGTDVDVPAKMIVDGKTYNNVGLRFRGTSSYGGVPRGQKRSLNVTVDLVDGKQSLDGYKTLNLLNSHTDPSFLRSVLYSHIARQYIPAPAANLVRVVINGESWGIYINEEQFNKDFVKKWFGEGDGPRWKVPPNFSGAAALMYQGDNPEDYRGLYEIKAQNEKQAWEDLIALCKKLEETPDDRLEAELTKILDIDRALWFLAVDNVFNDDDGYYSRGSDYVIYQDAQFKRFHIMPRDSNETFRLGGGGPGGPGGGGGAFFAGPGGPGGFDVLIGDGPGAAPPDGPRRGARGEGRGDAARGDRGGRGQGDGGPGGPGGAGRGPGGGGGATQDPLAQIDANNRPLVRRLMAIKHLRARYLAHVRTIVDESLNWEALEPVFESYRGLIADDVMRDTRNLSTFAEFFDADIAGAVGGGPFGGPPGIKRYVEERRAFLLKHPELSKPRPTIVAVDAKLPQLVNAGPKPQEAVGIVARVSSQVPAQTVLLYYAVGRNAPFQQLEMKADESQSKSAETTYTAAIPGAAAGARVYYYVEARADADVGTTTFSPPRAEFATYDYRVAGAASSAASDKPPTVVINELLAVNNRTIKDPQGNFADLIEVANTGTELVDLSGLHLSNSKDKPRKWKFPSGTTLPPGGYLIVWADSDSKATPGLHANFKLSKTGETVLLTDRDEHANRVIDSVEFGDQRANVSWGRSPDRTGKWQLITPTPGAANADR